MKKIFTIIALAMSLTASAEDFSLYYDLASGVKNTEVSAVSNLQKLVFDKEGKLIIYKKDGSSQTIDMSNVSRLFFSTPQTVDIKKLDNEKGEMNVFDLTGRKINADQSANKLPKGIYIINGKKTIIK